MNANVQIFEVHVLQGEQRGFLDGQTVVINQSKEQPIPRSGNDRKEPLELLLGEGAR
jgi:hypothetical protein